MRYLWVHCVAFFLLFSNALAYGSVESSLQLRAMFIYNFANFVQWPDKAFANDSSSINICLYGEVEFSNYLQPLAGTLVGDRELKVSEYKQGADKTQRCHMLFVGSDKKILSKSLFASKQFLYVLSVSENNQFIESGGIINILSQENQVSFEIDLQSAKNKGLFISSDLLSLAKSIKGL